jgi:hypothetical protein
MNTEFDIGDKLTLSVAVMFLIFELLKNFRTTPLPLLILDIAICIGYGWSAFKLWKLE